MYALASVAYSVYAQSLNAPVCWAPFFILELAKLGFHEQGTRAFIQETGFAPWVGVGGGFKVNKGRVVVCSLGWRNNLFLPYLCSGEGLVPMTLNSPTPPPNNMNAVFSCSYNWKVISIRILFAATLLGRLLKFQQPWFLRIKLYKDSFVLLIKVLVHNLAYIKFLLSIPSLVVTD